MDDFLTFDFASEGFAARRVYRKGAGPAVVILHELPGLIPECVDLARRVADAGFTVYLPLLFGEPNQPFSALKMAGNLVELCISQEFYCFARYQSSPITDWLRSLCRKAHADCGGRGVGVIGMCLTGSFVLSLMADPSVIAPVASQPSLPVGFTPEAKATLGVYPDELEKAQARAAQGVPLLALRYSEDALCPAEKFAALRQAFGGTPEKVEDSPELCWRRGKSLETLEINSAPGNPFEIPASSHAVLTLGYQEAGHPANRAFQRVVAFLKEQHFQ
jgi:dienelactone hydrolase